MVAAAPVVRGDGGRLGSHVPRHGHSRALGEHPTDPGGEEAGRRGKGPRRSQFPPGADVVDRMFTRAAEDLADIPRTELVRRALLQEALDFYQGFLKEKSAEPGVRHETALACLRVARIYQLPTLGIGQPHQGESACAGRSRCWSHSWPNSPAERNIGETSPTPMTS